MKFIGQFIQSLISRFRNDVYLEDVSSGTVASGGNLGLDSNNKIVKANVPAEHDAVTLAGTPDYITLSGQEITRNAIDLTQDVTGTLGATKGGTGLTSISTLLNSNVTSVSGNAGTATALATARDINGVSFDGTGDITVTAAGSTLSDTVTVAKGGTGATTLASNSVLTGNGTSAVQAESTLSYDSEILDIGADDNSAATIRRLKHTDEEGGDLYIRGGDATGTNKDGGDLQIFGGRATGSGAGGAVIIQAGETNASSGTDPRGTNVIASFRTDGDTLLQGNLIFEGSVPDTHETTFSVTNPTADRTITVPDSSGTMALTGVNYNYQYISFTGNATTPADGDWMVPSGNGISNHLWNVNASNGSGGSSNGKTKDSSNITVTANQAGNGIVVPQACVLVGFEAFVRNSSRHANLGAGGDATEYLKDQRSCGLFVGQPTFNDYAATGDLTLRCYSAQLGQGSPDNDFYLRITKATDMGNSISLSAGDMIVPAIAGTKSDGNHHSGGCIVSWTVVLKTLIP